MTHNNSAPDDIVGSDAVTVDDDSAFEPEELTAEEIARWDLARNALREVTPEETIGDPADEIDEGDGVISYLFENLMSGYPGWKWTVTIAQVDDSAPTILETELTPADGALVAPDWIPWAERMDDYHAAQVALGDDDDDSDDDDSEDDEDADEADDLADSDDDEDDEDDEFEDQTPVLHGGDLDGVDIDELDTDAAEESDDSEAASRGESKVDADDEQPSEPASDAAVESNDVVYVAEPFDLTAPDEIDEAPEPAEPTEPEAPSDVDDDRYAEPIAAPVRGVRRSRRATTATVFADKAPE